MPGHGDDLTDFEGIDLKLGPVIPPAAGVRAFTAQAVAFYFRAPVKAFFRTRVDYLAYARSLNPANQSGKFSWRATTPGILAHAVRTYGWRFIPQQFLPPLLANATIGATLYTSYLQILGRIHDPSSKATKVVFPPPSPSATFSAGFLAEAYNPSSLLLDALQVRFDRREQHYDGKSMWHYARGKLHDIGLRGIFAGWGLSFLKDSFGSAVFFCTFETVKSHGYFNFVRWYYGSLGEVAIDRISQKRGRVATEAQSNPIIRPHWALEPAFLFLAGLSASIAQQLVLHPLGLIQNHHFERLEHLDEQAKRFSQTPTEARGRMLKAYYLAYQETWRECKLEAKPYGSLRRYLYNQFLWNTIRQVPSTSAGLIIFELVRRKYGLSGDKVRINQDGYDILLT